MKRSVVMIIEHVANRYHGTFPDYPSIGKVESMDVATLPRAGVEKIEAEIARRRSLGAGMNHPRTIGAHVFGNLDLRGKFMTVIEAQYPG